MNFTIYAGDYLIFNRHIVDGSGNRPYDVLEPILNETTDGFNSLTYRCVSGTPAFDRSVELRTRIKVYEDGNLYWSGRVLSVQKNIYKQKEVYAEDFLGYFCDAIYRPFEFNGVASDFLENIIESYNQQVDESKRISDVVCDVSDSITRSSERYDSCWTTIKSKLLDDLGGFMWIEYDANELPILHYSYDPRDYSTQSIDFGKNLKNYNVKHSFGQFYTACVPLGHKDGETNQYITIAPANDGDDFLVDEVSSQIYGIIYAPTSETTWEDVNTPALLLSRARTWLQEKSSRSIEEIDLTGIDLSTLGVDVEGFHWLDGVQCTSDDFNEIFILKSISRRLDDVAKVSISMGDKRASIAGSTASNEANTINRIKTIESDYVTTGEARSISQEEIRNDTSIIQQAESIIATALEEYVRTSDYDTFRSTLATEFSILAGEVETGFTSTNSQITTLSGSTRQEFDSIYSFIRLLATITEGGVITQEGGIVIGESSSDIKLKLENDTLYFFMGDEKLVSNPIAWFSQNQLFVNNSTINNLTLGQTGAYLDARIVGEGDNICVLWSGRV